MIPRTANEPNGCPGGYLTGRQIRLRPVRAGRLSAMVPEDQGPPTSDRGLSERVADADRDRTVSLLREHVGEGRLTLDEFSERMGTALEAKTRGELDAVMADLPTTRTVPTASPTTMPPRKTSRWHIAVMSGHSTRGRWRIGGKTK